MGLELISVDGGSAGINDPVTVASCDLSTADDVPAGPARGQCATTRARATTTAPAGKAVTPRYTG